MTGTNEMAEVQQSLQRIESGQRRVETEMQSLRSEVMTLRGSFETHREEDRVDFKETNVSIAALRSNTDACFERRDTKLDEIMEIITQVQVAAAAAAGASRVSTRVIYSLAGFASSLLVALLVVWATKAWS